MYNKNRFRKLNGKKILHKIKKQWVVVSIAILGALGISGATEIQGHADSANHQTDYQNQTVTKSAKSSSARLVVQSSQINRDNANKAPLSQTLNQATNNHMIQHQAGVLHKQILSNNIKSIGHHHNSTNRLMNQNSSNAANQTLAPDHVTSNHIVNGHWGTAPFTFNPANGLLETTGKGTISPINELNNPDVKLKNIRAIKFAPGTQAPVNSSELFAVDYDQINTTDGPSDAVAYVSKLRNLSSIDVSNLDTSKVVNMSGMFRNDSDLRSINFGDHFNTDNVEATAGMFQSDLKLKSLDLSRFNTTNVLDMTSMFQSDYDLSDVNLGSNFDTDYTVYMYSLFRSDNSLSHLDLGNSFYTDFVIDDDPSENNGNGNNSNYGFSHMFNNDYALKSLNLGPNFNTKNARDFSDMFTNDSDLTSLDLGNEFNTTQASDMHNMFKGDDNLRSLNLGSNFDTLNANKKNFKYTYLDSNPYHIPKVNVQYCGTDGMFDGDSSLSTLIMLNSRLVPSTDLRVPNNMKWYLAKDNNSANNSVELNDGQFHTGTYKLGTTSPVDQTHLVFRNNNDVVSYADIKGLDGSSISFGALSNNLPSGYKLDVSKIKNLIQDIPNTPYQYQSGLVNVPVKKIISHNNQNNQNAQSVAQATDERIAEYYRNSVFTSVATVNHEKAIDAARKTDQSIAAFYRDSIASSVAAENQNRARDAARLADQQIDDSIATSYAKSADVNVAASVSNSVSLSDRSVADEDAERADQRIEQFYQNSVTSSVNAANQAQARSAANSADQRIQSSIARSYADKADAQIEQSEKASVSDSVSALGRQVAESMAKVANQRIEASMAQSYAASVSAQKAASISESASVENMDNDINKSQAHSYVDFDNSNTGRLTSNSREASRRDSSATSNNAGPAPLKSSRSRASSVNSRQTMAIRHDNSDRNKPVNHLKIGQKLIIGNRIVARAPIKYRDVRITHDCLAHNHITSVGKIKDYSGTLKRGTVIKVEKTFRVRVHHHLYNRYEINVDHHNYFVTANSLFNTSAYIQADTLKHHRSYGRYAHRYYRVMIRKPCLTYRSHVQNRRLSRGSVVKIRAILYTGRKGHRIPKLLLTNGQMITANKEYVKII